MLMTGDIDQDALDTTEENTSPNVSDRYESRLIVVNNPTLFFESVMIFSYIFEARTTLRRDHSRTLPSNHA